MNWRDKLRPLVVALLGVPVILVLWQASFTLRILHEMDVQSHKRRLTDRVAQVHAAVRDGRVQVTPASAESTVEMALSSVLLDLQSEKYADDLELSRYVLFMALGCFALQLAVALVPLFKRGDGGHAPERSRQQNTAEWRAT